MCIIIYYMKVRRLQAIFPPNCEHSIIQVHMCQFIHLCVLPSSPLETHSYKRIHMICKCTRCTWLSEALRSSLVIDNNESYAVSRTHVP